MRELTPGMPRKFPRRPLPADSHPIATRGTVPAGQQDKLGSGRAGVLYKNVEQPGIEHPGRMQRMPIPPDAHPRP